MKVPFKLYLMALLCLLITSSCKKETPTPEKDFFSTKINGALVEFTDNAVIKGDFSTSPSVKMIRIIGSGPNRMINVNILDYNGVGEYFLSDNQKQVLGAYSMKAHNGLQEENYAFIEGRVQILSITEDRIKGAFHFIATDYSQTIQKTIEGFFFLSINKS